MRQVHHLLDARQPGQPLERVHGAEGAVDGLGVGAMAVGAMARNGVGDPEQLTIELFDDLLRLREELISEFFAAVLSHRFLPALRLLLRGDGIHARRDVDPGRQHFLDQGQQLLGLEGLDQIGRGTQFKGFAAMFFAYMVRSSIRTDKS